MVYLCAGHGLCCVSCCVPRALEHNRSHALAEPSCWLVCDWRAVLVWSLGEWSSLTDIVPSRREQSRTVGWQHCCLVLGLRMVLSLDWPQVLASKSTFRVQGGRSVVMSVWQEETSPGKHSGQGRGAVVGVRWTWTEEAVGANQVWG